MRPAGPTTRSPTGRDRPEYASRHNLVYWRNGAYAAFGAGAHGRIGSERFMNHLKPLTYIEAVEAGAVAALQYRISSAPSCKWAKR